jgi:MFS family permease
LNVSAGIGVIGMASPMLQEVFGGQLLGNTLKFGELSPDQKTAIAAIAAGFTGLLSLFNIGGRFFWASISDKLGRKATYFTFFVLGGALYYMAPTSAHSGSTFLFVGSFCIILSMYGGGFATVPAYLADMFGTHMVGAIHGRLLTAWSTAGIIGPVLVNYLREYQLAAGVSREAAYDQTMYILAFLLVGGFICNLLVKPVAEHLYMTDEEVAAEAKTTVKAIHEEESRIADFEDAVEEGKDIEVSSTGVVGTASSGYGLILVLSWAAVGIPLAWGIWVTVQKAVILFK